MNPAPTAAAVAGRAPESSPLLRFRRELIVILAVKLALLTALWWLFFSPAHRPVIDAQAVAAHEIPVVSPVMSPAMSHEELKP